MQNSSIKHKQKRVEILVRGTVQGVGFRPFIYNLASRLEISGTVTNTGEGVVITATAQDDRLTLFLQAIEAEAPPLSRILSIDCRPLDVTATDGSFTILPSTVEASANTSTPPDIALCNDCLGELLDREDRRFGYPFINCTNCGPRFTIVETIPYDRPKTSMKVFPMCEPCTVEYNDPRNRRFHAQPNACADCGPTITLHDCKGAQVPGDQDPITGTVAALLADRVVAIRGLGGFHLAVNGCSSVAVEQLRLRKGRPHKPLAIMVRDMAAIESYCHVDSTERALLTSPEHPIVLLAKRPGTSLADNLSPAIREIGVMLPYTPLHHLLFATPNCPSSLVMTSGNISGVPLCTGNDDALNRLGAIADLFLLHNREIVTRVDDSVVKVTVNNPLVLRRARGFVPAPVQVPWNLPNILACGAGLKNTFSLARQQSVYISQHIGDLTGLEVYDFFLESVEHLKRVNQFEPEAVACDLHPDFISSRYAESLDLPLYRVQHHHAHAVAVMAEHGIEEPVLAVVLDGTGLGEDNTIWGGEILRAELTGFKRLAHLSHLLLPGGDAAATEPWRMGLSSLFATYGEDLDITSLHIAPLDQLEGEKVETILSMLQNNFNAPASSSCGRLFDAVASLLGVRQQISYEGQAAMELEALAKKRATSTWVNDILPKSHTTILPFSDNIDGNIEICVPEFVKMIVNGIHRGESVSGLSLRFHMMLIARITRIIERLSHETRIHKVVLSGGCMQNSLLLEGLFHTLSSINMHVFTGNLLPINDGAISFGQSITGGLRHVSRHSNESNQRLG